MRSTYVRSVFWLLAVTLPFAGVASAQQRAERAGGLDPALLEADRKIMAEIRHNSKVMENL